MDDVTLKIVLAVLSAGLVTVTTLFWRLWATLATKTELVEAEQRIAANDSEQDEKIAGRIGNEMKQLREDVLRMHSENRQELTTIHNLLLRERSRHA